MPNVLHLFNIFGALTERAMHDYTLGLSKAGFDLSIACESIVPEAPKTDLPIAILKRIHVDPTDNVPAQMNDIFSDITDPAFLALLKQPFDLIHAHFGPRLLHAAPFIERGIPTILSTYGYDLGRLLRDPTWIARYQWAAQNGVTFVPLANSMQQKLLSLGIPQKNLNLIHLGIDLTTHPFTPRAAPLTPRFVFIGRFVDKKGADTLIDAMRHLIHAHHTPATLDLIGAGPNEISLRAQAQRANLSPHVNFLGLIPFSELPRHLTNTTALIQPSQTASDGDAEGAPMVLMTAQALGLPCITTLHSGNPETIPPLGKPFIVPERDPFALATAMRAMINQSAHDRSLLQSAGRHWIEQNYNLEKTITRYATLYRHRLT